MLRHAAEEASSEQNNRDEIVFWESGNNRRWGSFRYDLILWAVDLYRARDALSRCLTQDGEEHKGGV